MLGTLMPADRLTARGSGWLSTLVRLAPGASLAQAQAGVDVLAERLVAAHPDINADRGMRLFPLWRQPSGGTAQLLPVLAVLGGVVAVLLALVCANMAGLLLARASGRQRELAVRVSLGASRWQVVRLLVAETIVLAVVAGILAATVTVWSGNLLHAFIPPLPIPLAIDAGLSLRVLIFSSLVSLVAGLALGLLPGLQSSRGDLVAPLKDGAAMGGSARRGWLRQGLIVAQLALALVLLVSAGLFLRTLMAADRLDVGFTARQGLVGVLDVGSAGDDPARGLATYQAVTAALAEVPGVEAVAIGQRLPLTSLDSSDRTVQVEGYTPAPGEELTTYYASIGPRYFEALGLPLVAGRDVSDRDTADAPPAVIINETMARRYWADRPALGGRVKIGERWAEVVGIAHNAKYASLSEPARAFMYLPVAQAFRPSMRVVLRTSGDPDALVPAVRQTLARVAPGVPLFDVQTLEQHIAFSFFLLEMAATMLAVFGATAALLAALGLYGVMAQGVAARTREIGVRMSLGATAADVGRLVVGQGLGLAAAGIVAGLAGAAAVTRLFESQLLGVSPLDPAAFAATTTLLAATAFAACAVPAWRAARLNPVQALRTD
jgi:macrolide transport system ATP-binding/permease protein